MVTGNDNSQYPGRNPKSWTLYGCNADTAPDEDYGGWEVVHKVTDDATMEDRNGTAYYFALDQASPAYEYYMLKVSEKNSFVMQLSEFASTMRGFLTPSRALAAARPPRRTAAAESPAP